MSVKFLKRAQQLLPLLYNGCQYWEKSNLSTVILFSSFEMPSSSWTSKIPNCTDMGMFLPCQIDTAKFSCENNIFLLKIWWVFQHFITGTLKNLRNKFIDEISKRVYNNKFLSISSEMMRVQTLDSPSYMDNLYITFSTTESSTYSSYRHQSYTTLFKRLYDSAWDQLILTTSCFLLKGISDENWKGICV